jgi:non-heme chloroperoxidase
MTATVTTTAPTAAESGLPGTPGHFTTSDGVRLHYREAGSGQVLLMIPGWSQTAAEFKHQIRGLSDRYRVIALDMRGHGESEKPEHGYKIARLAKDVHEIIHALDLHDVVLLGHSMGCSVIWSYWDQFGAERLAKLVLVDQMPMVAGNPAWSADELADAGSIFTPQSLYETVNALAGPEGAEATRGFIAGMVTPAMPADELAWMIDENLKMPRRHAATLLFNHATQDWRDVIPRIRLPVLVVGGRVSLIPWRSVAWTHDHIPGSRLEIFEAEEGGQHFMFLEAPDKFNTLVTEFIG